jgi:hypothetical protein
MGLRLGLTAGLARCLSAGGRAVRERGGDAPEPPAGAGDLHRLGLPSRQEGVDLVVPGEAALGVAEEVQAGRPAAAHQHGVAGDLARRLRVSVRHAGDAQRLHPQAARRAGDGAAEQRLDAERQGAVGQGGVHIQADVDDRDGLRAGLGQVEGCVPGRVVRGDDRRAIAHLDAVALEERLRRAGEHHARPVVAVEDQWLLERALWDRVYEPVIRADVEGERGPAVLAPGLEAVAELLDRGAGVGLEAAWAAGGAHQRVRLVGAGGDDAAGPVVLERPAHEVHPAGEQRRCQRVAGEGLAVEGEADRARVVDAAAALDAVPSHSVPPSGWGGRGGARPPCRSQGTGRRPSRVRR